MKKYYLYALALGLTTGLMSACSNADEATEITEQAPAAARHSILVRFANAGQTRVAMQGVALEWSENDAIGVIYKSPEYNAYRAVKYIYKETTSEGARFEADADDVDGQWTLQNYNKTGMAFYPYQSDYSDEVRWVNDLDRTTIAIYYQTELELGKTEVTMVGSESDSEDDVYTFDVANAVLSVTVKGLPRNTFSSASITSYHYLLNEGDLNLYEKCLNGGVMPDYKSDDDYDERSFDLSPLNTGESGTVDQTFNFPLPTNVDLDDLTFTLKSASPSAVQDVTFKLATFTPKPNTKYSKVIALDEEGARKSLNAVEQANADLEVSGKVAVDISGWTDTDITFYIPERVTGGTSVDFTIKNATAMGSRDVIEIAQADGVATAKDVNLCFADDAIRSMVDIKLPTSNLSFTGGCCFASQVALNNAKTVTCGSGAFTFNSLSVKRVDKLVLGETTTIASLRILGYGNELEPCALTVDNSGSIGNLLISEYPDITIIFINRTGNAIACSDELSFAALKKTTVHFIAGVLQGDIEVEDLPAE
jgi:hypothetical protein